MKFDVALAAMLLIRPQMICYTAGTLGLVLRTVLVVAVVADAVPEFVVPLAAAHVRGFTAPARILVVLRAESAHRLRLTCL